MFDYWEQRCQPSVSKDYTLVLASLSNRRVLIFVETCFLDAFELLYRPTMKRHA
jgi:hypothetical protein